MGIVHVRHSSWLFEAIFFKKGVIYRAQSEYFKNYNLTDLFLFFCADHFPSLQEISDAIWTQWTYPDVPFTQLSRRTYEVIQVPWRERHRDQLVAYLAEMLTSEDRVSKIEIQDAVKILQDVWKSDSCDLIELVYNKIVMCKLRINL